MSDTECTELENKVNSLTEKNHYLEKELQLCKGELSRLAGICESKADLQAENQELKSCIRTMAKYI